MTALGVVASASARAVAQPPAATTRRAGEFRSEPSVDTDLLVHTVLDVTGHPGRSPYRPSKAGLGVVLIGLRIASLRFCYRSGYQLL